MWNSWWPGSSSAELDFVDLCQHSARTSKDFARVGNLLNKKQCQDLSSKLSKITLNVGELALHCGGSSVFKPALENLYLCLEKAKVLLDECGKEDWLAAAVFQIQNEKAFQEILLEVFLCYNAIYEQATSGDCKFHTQDLRQSSVFSPASDRDVNEDQLDLEKKLVDLANEPSWLFESDPFQERRALKHCLAQYTLIKLRCTSQLSPANPLETGSAILWRKPETELPGTWENSKFLGSGSGASGVTSTKWLGIPCAKKEFHGQEIEEIFLKEAGLLVYLKHPRIVNFICCGNGQEKGDRFIAMELMQKSLFDQIEAQKGENFSLPVAVDMMVQMARGMFYLHDQNIAHRDLKPQNVVVNKLTSPHLGDYFCVKLVDFGMSKTIVEASKSITISGSGVGTTRYRAPEVHPNPHHNGKRKTIWFKVDVYSFAITCAHILCLKTPFENVKRLTELQTEILNGLRPKLPPNCPQELVLLLKDCWNTEPRSRPSFKEICIRLEKIRHKILRGFSADQGFQEEYMDFSMGFHFVETKMEEQSFKTKISALRQFVEEEEVFVDNTDHEAEGEVYDLQNRAVPTIPCTSNHPLEFYQRLMYPIRYHCNMCRKSGKEQVYHCKTCEFDAHPNCAEIKDEVEVFFHNHPLHLQIRYYYNKNSGIICGFCHESVQGGEWVYKCEQCDFDVHALCTKYSIQMEHFKHLEHRITLIESSPDQSRLCTCCHGIIKGYGYICTERLCSFNLHPFCATIPTQLPCIIDKGHMLSLIIDQRQGFSVCRKCGLPGSSWFYSCKYCVVDIHLECR